MIIWLSFQKGIIKVCFFSSNFFRGYDSAGANQSNLAFKFMNWYAKKHGVEIQNADSAEGEKKSFVLKIIKHF